MRYDEPVGDFLDSGTVATMTKAAAGILTYSGVPAIPAGHARTNPQ